MDLLSQVAFLTYRSPLFPQFPSWWGQPVGHLHPRHQVTCLLTPARELASETDGSRGKTQCR